MEKNKKSALKEILSGKPLETFDVRDYELRRILEKNSETVGEDWSRYRNTENVLVKTVIGKKWMKEFDFDYDASYFANLVYREAFFPGSVIEQSLKRDGKVRKDVYVTVWNDDYFRGDTMNSWRTTLIEYFRLFGDKHLKLKYLEKNNSNKRKWCIKKACRKELGLKESESRWKNGMVWADFLSVPAVYQKDNPVPSYITGFMKVVYTIGNFIPVPCKGDFNRGRNRRCKDYWDLTLLAIYRHYNGNDAKNSKKWVDLLSRKGVKHWLDGYGSWDKFVERNFLQDFVNQKKNGYGRPKELWKGHFTGAVLPKKEEQFKEFFTNAAAWITARGTRIAIAMADALGPAAEQKNDAGE